MSENSTATWQIDTSGSPPHTMTRTTASRGGETVLSPVERARVSEMEAEIRRLRMENEFLKSSGLLRQDAAVAERCAVIEAGEGQLQDRLDVSVAAGAAVLVLPVDDGHGDTERGATSAARHQREHQRLLRQYFPKGTDLSLHTVDEL